MITQEALDATPLHSIDGPVVVKAAIRASDERSVELVCRSCVDPPRGRELNPQISVFF
jgi:hypothetical protein